MRHIKIIDSNIQYARDYKKITIPQINVIYYL